MTGVRQGKVHPELARQLEVAPDGTLVAFLRLKAPLHPAELTPAPVTDWHQFQRQAAEAAAGRVGPERRECAAKIRACELECVGETVGEYVLVRGSAASIRKAIALECVTDAVPDFDLILWDDEPAKSATDSPAVAEPASQSPRRWLRPVFSQLTTILRNYPWSPVGQLVAPLTEALDAWSAKPEDEKKKLAGMADGVLACLGREFVALGAAFEQVASNLPLRPRLELVLRQMLLDVGGWSVAMFVADPWNPGEFRPYIIHGFRYPEPLYSCYGPRARAVLEVAADGDEAFYKEARSIRHDVEPPSRVADEDFPDASRELERLSREKPAFGPLTMREGIASAARLSARDEGGGVRFVLWVNFVRTVAFDADPWVKDRLCRCRDELARLAIVGAIERELLPVFPSPGILRLDRACESLQRRAVTPPSPGLTVDAALTPFLEEVLQAVRLPAQSDNHRDKCGRVEPLADTGSASIYLVERGTGQLTIVATSGRCRPGLGGDRTPRQSLREGRGIAVWAALRGHPVLANNITGSRFRAIYEELHGDIRHELAIPMVVGTRVIGVLNLESSTTEFPHESIPVLIDVAVKAARACDLFERQQRERLLEDKQREAQGTLLEAGALLLRTDNERQLFDLWAKSACDSLDGTFCTVWGDDNAGDLEQFRLLGRHEPTNEQHSARPDDPTAESPRGRTGWTYYVRQTGLPVCLTRKVTGGFQPLFWWKRGERPTWHEDPDPRFELPLPQTVHPAVSAGKLMYELSLPLFGPNGCFGVAWIKYKNEPPRQSLSQTKIHEWLPSLATTMRYQFDGFEADAPSPFKMASAELLSRRQMSADEQPLVS